MVIADYIDASGASVKQIESTLRLYKQTLQNAERGGKWLNKE